MGPWQAVAVKRHQRDQLGAGDIANLPNAITLASFGLGLWWVAGGPWWSAIASILGDEVDGRVARKMGTTSDFGADFDWGTDLVLTPLALRKLKAPWWAIGGTTVGQIWFRGALGRPSIGSVRAAVMLYGVIVEERKKRALAALGPKKRKAKV